MQNTEDLLDRVFLSRAEAIGAFLQTAKSTGFPGRIEENEYIILDWVLELIASHGWYFFRQNEKTKRTFFILPPYILHEHKE